MKKALIFEGRMVDLVADGSEFPVAPAMQWVDAPDDASHETHEFDGVAVVTKVTSPRFVAVPAALSGRKAECDALAAKKRGAITQGISPAEMASWSIKRAEAMAYQASGNAVDAPMLQVEATARGVTLADLSGKVMTKAGLLSAFEAQIAGINGKHNDALEALALAPGTDVAAMEAYDITTGWPV